MSVTSINYVQFAINDQITATSSASPDTLYTNSSGSGHVEAATAYNSSGSSVLLSVYILPSGVAASSVDPAWVQTIAATSAVILDGLIGRQVPNGGTIKAFAGTTNVIRVNIDGQEVV